MDLYRRSIEVILDNQADTGAYIASPSFPSYAYCWLRDGSFIAHAMDQVGQHGSAKGFFRWVDRTIRHHSWKVDRVLALLDRGQKPEEQDYLHTRYTLQGKETESEWWNFQLDGYGTWLWAFNEHLAKTQDTVLLQEAAKSIAITARYLCAVWRNPNYDCWEENPDSLSPYTLAAIYAGLSAAEQMATDLGLDKGEWVKAGLPEVIRRFTLEHGMRDGILVKQFHLPAVEEAITSDGEPMVDASLVGVATPYRLLLPEDPILKSTVAQIETDLHRPGGGVYRYRADTYFGGGEWLLLSAWLGWYYTQIGELEKGSVLFEWVEDQADGEGYLPEQISSHLLAPEHYLEWETRWGPIAKPLLWSHAMYLILHQALAEVG
jgi:GH15 family glucan-1,4-alpha-glucosidase